MSEIDAPRLLIPARHQAANRIVDYNMLDGIKGMNASEVKTAQYEFYLAHEIGIKLMRAYPQRQWGVVVNLDIGSVQITCPSLSATKGYVIHIKRKTLHELQEQAIRAGGEILERFGISRGRTFDPTSIELLPRDERDEAVSADSKADFALKKWS
jgi:hypothetical protein